MADMHLGDIELGGKPYRIDFDSWRGKDVIDFAPRATVPGGSAVMSDLGLFQPLLQTDWRHGFGFHWYSDAMGYMQTIGNMDTRQDGLAMLFTKATSSDTQNNVKRGMAVFNSNLYAWGSAGLRKFNGTAWSAIDIRKIETAGAITAEVAASTTLSTTVTVADNVDNALLVVFVGTKADVTVSALTFNGDALTQKATSGTAPKLQLYFLTNPDAGSNTLSLTVSGSTDIEIAAYVIYGVDTSSPLDAASTQSTAAGTASTIDITSASGDLVIDGIILDAATAPTAGAGQTSMGSDTIADLGLGASKEDGATTTTMSWSWAGATDAEQIAVNVNLQAAQPTVNFALAAGAYLFIAPDGGRIKKMDTSEAVTNAGLDINAADFKWLILHNGYIYAGKDNSNAIHFDNSETLGTLQGNSSDTNRILIGVGSNPTFGAIIYNGNLYVRKSDGVWIVGEDRIARRMLDFTSEDSVNNLRSWAVINGYLVLPMRDRILQWNGARVSDITPHKITDDFPYTTYGRFNNFVAVGDFLYITARTNESTYDEDLLVFDGVGWHKLATLLDGVATGEITMLVYEAINNRLWYHRDEASDTTYYIPFQNYSTFPYADFPTTGQHSLISSRIDAGFRRVQKSMDKVYLEARNCSATVYLKVYYSLDGGDWVHWRDVKENGIIEVKNPGGSYTREFNYLQLRIDFVTGSATQSPILEGMSLSFIMRPDTRMGYNFNVVAVTEYEHGMYKDDRTSQEILDDLKAARNSKSPIALLDIFGRSHVGYVTAIQEQPIFRVIEGDNVDVEVMFNVNFVEI